MAEIPTHRHCLCYNHAAEKGGGTRVWHRIRGSTVSNSQWTRLPLHSSADFVPLSVAQELWQHGLQRPMVPTVCHIGRPLAPGQQPYTALCAMSQHTSEPRRDKISCSSIHGHISHSNVLVDRPMSSWSVHERPSKLHRACNRPAPQPPGHATGRPGNLESPASRQQPQSPRDPIFFCLFFGHHMRNLNALYLIPHFST